MLVFVPIPVTQYLPHDFCTLNLLTMLKVHDSLADVDRN